MTDWRAGSERGAAGRTDAAGEGRAASWRLAGGAGRGSVGAARTAWGESWGRAATSAGFSLTSLGIRRGVRRSTCRGIGSRGKSRTAEVGVGSGGPFLEIGAWCAPCLQCPHSGRGTGKRNLFLGVRPLRSPLWPRPATTKAAVSSNGSCGGRREWWEGGSGQAYPTCCRRSGTFVAHGGPPLIRSSL